MIGVDVTDVLSDRIGEMTVVEMQEAMADMALGLYKDHAGPNWLDEQVWRSWCSEHGLKAVSRVVWGMLLETEVRKGVSNAVSD